MRASIKRPPTPDAEEEDQDREPTLQEIINIKLIESGEKERLKELLRERLIECGWKDEMKSLCRSFTRKKGRNNVTVDDLVHLITPKGRGLFVKHMRHPFVGRKKYTDRNACCCFTHAKSCPVPSAVPDSVKAELLQRIRSFLQSAAL